MYEAAAWPICSWLARDYVPLPGEHSGTALRAGQLAAELVLEQRFRRWYGDEWKGKRFFAPSGLPR